VSWALDQATRTLRAEVDLENPDGVLRPGLYAYATIIAEEATGALTLPDSAIVREEGRAYCVVVEGGVARHREVEPGLSDGQRTEVRSGLDGTEAVVTANPAALADGQAVEAAPPAGAPAS